MHYLMYKVRPPLELLAVCGLYLESDNVIDATGGDDTRYETEFNLIAVDSERVFHVIDTARQVESFTFKLDSLGMDKPLSLVGNLQRTGEFLLLTDSGCMVCSVADRTCTVMRTLWSPAASASPFADGYLAVFPDGEVYFMNTEKEMHYFRNRAIKKICTDHEMVVFHKWKEETREGMYKFGSRVEFWVTSPQAKVRRTSRKQIFDLHDGFITIFSIPSTLLVINAKDPKKRIQITVSHRYFGRPYIEPTDIKCGVNSNNLQVLIFSLMAAVMVNVPLTMIRA